MTSEEEKRSSFEEEKSDGVQSVLVRPDGTDDEALMAAAEEIVAAMKEMYRKAQDRKSQ